MDILYQGTCKEAFVQKDLGDQVRLLLGRCSIVVEKAKLIEVDHASNRKQARGQGQEQENQEGSCSLCEA